MKFSAAAVSKREAIPSLRKEEDTNIRGIPSGVGKGSGEQYRDVDASTVIKSPSGDGCAAGGRNGELFWWTVFSKKIRSVVLTVLASPTVLVMRMAVAIGWAITQPTIFSRGRTEG